MKIIILGLIFISIVTNAFSDIYYVKVNGDDNNTGKNWKEAFASLQKALDVVRSGDFIYIAEGTYNPTYDYGLNIGERGKHFRMKNGVTIFGGFPSTGMPFMHDRDWEQYPTILSGDLNGDDYWNDGTDNWSNREDNCYHVFYHPEETKLDSTAVLDGVVISGGHANYGNSNHDQGGGICNNLVFGPTLRNCRITNNYASRNGGGIIFLNTWEVVSNKNLILRIINCTFDNNFSIRGGAIFIDLLPQLIKFNNFEIINSIFKLNKALGGASIFGGVIKFLNCLFTEHQEKSSAILQSGYYDIDSCEFSYNKDLSIYEGTSIIKNTLFIKNEQTPVVVNDSHFENCIFKNNVGYAGGGVSIRTYLPSKILIYNCLFEANIATGPRGAAINIGPWGTNGIAQIRKNTFIRNKSVEGSGALGLNSVEELGYLIDSCIFIENSGYIGGAVNIVQSHIDTFAPTIIQNSQFIENTSENGGAIYDFHSRYLKIANCNFQNNFASNSGGVIYSNYGNILVFNSLFNYNHALNEGGVIWSKLNYNNLSNSTFVNNKAGIGGAIYADSSNLYFNNSILWDNIADDVAEHIYSFGSNIYLNHSCYSNIDNDIVTNESDIFIENSITENPLFIGSGEHPYLISANSPCIDAGNNDYINETYDIRGEGYPRKLNGKTGEPGIVDIGAYEYQFGTDPVTTISTQPNYSISIYPNPVTEYIHIITDVLISQIELCDYLGRTLFKQSNNVELINTNGLAPGVYLLKIYTYVGEVLTEKVVVK